MKRNSMVAIGVLEFAPRRGAWVRDVSLSETIESLEVRTRVIMDFLASVDPVKLAKEHQAIVDALDRGAPTRPRTCWPLTPTTW